MPHDDDLDGCQAVLDDTDVSDPDGHIVQVRMLLRPAEPPLLEPLAGFDTGIADRLRAAGLRVVEVSGWQTRGSSGFNPRGSVDHHTAGPRAGNAPSLATCIKGRSDLPGPLCHVHVARDNTCHVVAAGRANHAGIGGYRGLSGNSSMYGVERENVGTSAEPWRPDQTETAARVHAALMSGPGIPAEMLCGHREWTPRKPDAHSVNYVALRARVAELLAGGGAVGLSAEDRAVAAQLAGVAAATAALLS